MPWNTHDLSSSFDSVIQPKPSFRSAISPRKPFLSPLCPGLAGPLCEGVSLQLWQVLLQLQATQGEEGLASAAREASAALSQACGWAGPTELAERHAPAILAATSQVGHLFPVYSIQDNVVSRDGAVSTDGG